ncbi:BACON domain-containing protein [Chitinophaga sp. S165]|uniref:BACON domain-containing protein n=1 Tax=Chitinophaga sp. S165 TaxID=2135462 RepID=UPI000D711A92|nr:BACON domain-containing protein [Chitinophaga sp. S165]PWV46182.1 hypothetical protein C7475_11185 [Chitinophaga sp. S165]
MTERIACLLAAIVLLFSYCKKDAQPEKVTLTADQPDLSLFGLAGSTTSFNLQTQGGWQIISTEDWVTTDVSSGTGDALITVKASMTNTTTTYRTATLIVKSTSDTSIHPVNITVVQQAVEINISPAKFSGGSWFDYWDNAVKTKDGGFIMTGMVGSEGPGLSLKGGSDIWVIKTDANGGLVWQKAFGGRGQDIGRRVIEMEDGGYAVVGTVEESSDGDISAIHGLNDAAIIRLDASGNIIWKKVWGGSRNEQAYALAETADGGFIVSGSSESNDGDMAGQLKGPSDIWLLSLDKDGNSRWQKTVGGMSGEDRTSIIKTTQNTYLLLGLTASNDGEFASDVTNNYYHAFIREIDANGNKLMHVNYAGSQFGWLTSGVQTADGGFILAGSNESHDGDFISNRGGRDAWLLKIDRRGNKIWQKLLGGSSSDQAYSVRIVDNGYLVLADSWSENRDVKTNLGDNDLWVFQVDDKGAIQWQKSFGGTGSDNGCDIFYNADKTITVLGTFESNDENCKGNPGSYSPAVFQLTVR